MTSRSISLTRSIVRPRLHAFMIRLTSALIVLTVLIVSSTLAQEASEAATTDVDGGTRGVMLLILLLGTGAIATAGFLVSSRYRSDDVVDSSV